MRITIICIIILSSLRSTCQSILIRDLENGSPIENATVFTIIDQRVKLLGFSDDQGKFQINKNESYPIVIISGLSYVSDTLLQKDLTKDTLIRLKRRSHELDSVQIQSRHFKNSVTIATGTKKINHYTSSVSNGMIGSFLNIDTTIKAYRIQDISFEIAKLKKNDCKQVVVLYVLHIDDDTSIYRCLYEPVIINLNNRDRQIFNVHLNDYITTPILNSHSVFLALEWQRLDCKKEVSDPIFFLQSVEVPQINTYYYHIKKAKWISFPNNNKSGSAFFSMKISY